jgi:hypothetical protein
MGIAARFRIIISTRRMKSRRTQAEVLEDEARRFKKMLTTNDVGHR